MNDPHIWWYVTRSSAILAWILMTLAVVWGVLLSTRIFRKVDDPGHLQDLHRYLGGLSLVMVAVHIVSLMLDGWLHFTPLEALVPGQAAYRTIPVALGIVAFYLLFVVYGSSLLRNRLPPRFWKGLHYSNYCAVILIGFHAGLTGTDVGHWWYFAVAVALLSLTSVALIVRLVMSTTPAGRQLGSSSVSPRMQPLGDARVADRPLVSTVARTGDEGALLAQLGFTPTAVLDRLPPPQGMRQPAIEPPGTAADVMTLIVAAVFDLAVGVRGLRLVAPGGGDLPPWHPGAHVTLELPNGDTRQYSLCGDPADRRFYDIAVLREIRSRGGSQWIHDAVHPGTSLRVWAPRNHFPLDAAPEYLFVAGGIGITPIRSMIESLPAKREWKLIYLGRSRATMAYLPELLRDHPSRAFPYARDEHAERLDVAGVVTQLGGEIYCCGPDSLIRDVEAAGTHRRLHSEHFEPVARPGLIARPLRLSLARSGLELTVAEDRTVLDVLEENRVPVLASCRRGVCGSCEVRVLGGEPEHRDSVRADDEKSELGIMFPCVSRARGDLLTLDV